MGVGNIDAHLGDDFYAAAKERGIQVIEAGPNQPAGVAPYIVKNINGVKVGVISFGSGEAKSLAEAKSLDVLKARYVAFREARKASDVLILLDQADVANDDWLQRNVQRLGSPDVVIGPVSRAMGTEGRKVGTTIMAPVASQARNCGVISIYADKSGVRIETSSVDLGEKIAEDRKVADMLVEAEKAKMTPVTPATPSPSGTPPPPPTPAGAQH